jgi:hypothetical protein
MFKATIAAMAGAALMAAPVFAQYPAFYPGRSQSPAYYPPPVQAAQFYPDQLAGLVQPIALYPDPLLAQVLAASTYWNQIPEAAAWAGQHSYLTGDALANAIYAENVPWDPSVVALLPFPSVLDMMASDPGWTQALGSAVLANRDAVMDAVQQMRQAALADGYLQNTAETRVVEAGPGDIEIVPVEPSYIYVPAYDPAVVFGGRRVGVSVGISWGAPVFVGGPFVHWGWGGSGFAWRSHSIVIDRHAGERTPARQYSYARPYQQPVVRMTAPREERRQPAVVNRPSGTVTEGGRREGGSPQRAFAQGGHFEGGHGGERGHGGRR